MEQALLTALSNFPYGRFILISRQLQIMGVKDLCSLADKAATRNMYVAYFGELIIYGAIVLLSQGTDRLSFTAKQLRLSWDHHK